VAGIGDGSRATPVPVEVLHDGAAVEPVFFKDLTPEDLTLLHEQSLALARRLSEETIFPRAAPIQAKEVQPTPVTVRGPNLLQRFASGLRDFVKPVLDFLRQHKGLTAVLCCALVIAGYYAVMAAGAATVGYVATAAPVTFVVNQPQMLQKVLEVVVGTLLQVLALGLVEYALDGTARVMEAYKWPRAMITVFRCVGGLCAQVFMIHFNVVANVAGAAVRPTVTDTVRRVFVSLGTPTAVDGGDGGLIVQTIQWLVGTGRAWLPAVFDIVQNMCAAFFHRFLLRVVQRLPPFRARRGGRRRRRARAHSAVPTMDLFRQAVQARTETARLRSRLRGYVRGRKM
jgi:hypothetical protein